MICPKCGQTVQEQKVICDKCNFIMDTTFLGEDILDEEKELRPGPGGVSPALFNLRNANVLSDIEDAANANFDNPALEATESKEFAERLYVSGRSQAAIAPDAIPAIVQMPQKTECSPFESHVLDHVNGKRPVEMIQRRAGLNEIEVKTVLATLTDRGIIKMIGRAFANNIPLDESGELSLTDQGVFDVPTQNISRRNSSSYPSSYDGLDDKLNPDIEELFKTKSVIAPLNSEERAALQAPNEDSGVFERESLLGIESRDYPLPKDADFVNLPSTGALKPFNSAIDQHRAEMSANSKEAEARLYDEARLLEKEGRITEAIKCLEAGIQLNNKLPSFFNQLGIIYALHRKEYTKAASFIRQAIVLEPNNAHYKSNLAKVLPEAERR